MGAPHTLKVRDLILKQEKERKGENHRKDGFRSNLQLFDWHCRRGGSHRSRSIR